MAGGASRGRAPIVAAGTELDFVHFVERIMARQKAISSSALIYCTSPVAGDIQKIGVHMPSTNTFGLSAPGYMDKVELSRCSVACHIGWL